MRCALDLFIDLFTAQHATISTSAAATLRIAARTIVCVIAAHVIATAVVDTSAADSHAVAVIAASASVIPVAFSIVFAAQINALLAASVASIAARAVAT